MASCTTRIRFRATTDLWKCAQSSQKYLGILNLPNSTIIQKRSFFIMPFGTDIGLVGAIAYKLTKLKLPDPRNVLNIFGPRPGTKESELYPEKTVSCIAHRGAGKDAPENTLEAFKYCIERGCKFFEFDVRSSRDGKLVLLHDEGLERLATGSSISNLAFMDWDSIKNIDVGTNHPNRRQFKEVHLCLLDEALDYLLKHDAKMIIDIKGNDKTLIDGILKAFMQRHQLYDHAAIACFNPFVLYKIRKMDPNIVSTLSYKPYAFSADDYDAEIGALNPKTEHMLVYAGLRCLDKAYSLVWRWFASWCGVSAVLLHKDIVSRDEIHYWLNRDVRCVGWCVNSPIEKLYWNGVLKAPYMANTLLGEPVEDEKKIVDAEEVVPTRKTVLE